MKFLSSGTHRNIGFLFNMKLNQPVQEAITYYYTHVINSSPHLSMKDKLTRFVIQALMW